MTLFIYLEWVMSCIAEVNCGSVALRHWRCSHWLASALGYLHKAIWLADACLDAYIFFWKVFNFCHEQRQWRDTTDPRFSSTMLDGTLFKVNEWRWRWRLVWMYQKLSTLQTPTQVSANQIALCKYPGADTSQSHSCNTRKLMWLAVVTMVASAPSFRHALHQASMPMPHVNVTLRKC